MIRFQCLSVVQGYGGWWAQWAPSTPAQASPKGRTGHSQINRDMICTPKLMVTTRELALGFDFKDFQ
jgi:hypothetical protein